MDNAIKFYKEIDKRIKNKSSRPVQIGKIISKAPLIISFIGTEIGTQFGDKIYLNQLLLDESINLDVASMDQPQNFNNTSAYQSPSFTGEVSGTQKQFLIDFYNYFKQWQKRYIIDIGDLVAIQKLGQNTYLILEKVQLHNEQ